MQYSVEDGKFKFKAADLTGLDQYTWGSRGGTRFPGIVLKIHGQPAQQYTQARNGPFVVEEQLGWDPYTGVEGHRKVYYPKSVDSFHYGGSYVVVAPGSGIGLGSKLGEDESGMDYFMQHKHHYSSNPETMAMYISFWAGHGDIYPFAEERGIMDVHSGQGVHTLSIDNGTQVQQKMGWELQNIASGVQIEYSLNTLLHGKGQDKTTSRVWYDPNTKHMVVGGVMNGPGTQTICNTKGTYPQFATWNNLGYRTSRGITGNRMYRVQVEWEQFVETLFCAAHYWGETPAQMFGVTWDQPDTWQLTKVRYAHENHNLVFGNMRVGGCLKNYRIKGI